jgi:hypothetical protein
MKVHILYYHATQENKKFKKTKQDKLILEN